MIVIRWVEEGCKQWILLMITWSKKKQSIDRCCSNNRDEANILFWALCVIFLIIHRGKGGLRLH